MKNPHAQALGRLGGKSTSKAKSEASRRNIAQARASRENGKKGGSPAGKLKEKK